MRYEASFSSTAKVLAACFLLLSHFALQASTPTASTGAPTQLTSAGATLNGIVLPNGLAASAYFEWGPSTTYGRSTATNAVPASTGSASVAVAVSSLGPVTAWHYRLVTSGAGGVARGADQSFTTLASPPVASTLSAQSIGTTSAILAGTAAGSQIMGYFQWGLTTAYGNTTPAFYSPAGSINSTASLPELASGASYHYRFVAINSGGASYGADVTFSTLTQPPLATTTGASGVGQTTAVLNGVVNPNWLPTTYIFEWGLNTAYGSSTTVQTAGQGAGPDTESFLLANLTPNTPYHYRISAANAAGSSKGADSFFFTLPVLPSAATGLAAGVSGSNATLNGMVNPNGYPAYCYFKWGLTSAYGSTTPASSPGGGPAYQGTAANITGLLPATTYHYQLVATNTSGLSAGLDQTFTTTAFSPSTTTAPATQIGVSSGMLNGSANPNGLASSAYFLWGSTSNYSSETLSYALAAGQNPVALSSTLSGLAPGGFHYAMAAVSPGGIAIGADQSFATFVTKPGVQTTPAININQNFATLEGLIDPNGLASTYFFQYGTTTNYTITTLSFGAGQGNVTNSVAFTATGLASDTTYHFRIVGSSAGGVSYGQDLQFTTIAPSPTVVTYPAQNITASSALLSGTVLTYGLQDTYYFRWGPTTNYGSTTLALPVSSAAPVQVSASIGSLSPGTTYHFQLVAAATDGHGSLGSGYDQSFQTLPRTAARVWISQARDQIAITWEAQPGQAYWIQYKTSLDSTPWLNLTKFTATNSSPTVFDNIVQDENRVYRVVPAD